MKTNAMNTYLASQAKQHLPAGFKVSSVTLDGSNSTYQARSGHRMRTLVQVQAATGDIVAIGEAKVSTLDRPDAQRGADIAFGRALKQVRTAGYDVK
jgi:hypothetical protein